MKKMLKVICSCALVIALGISSNALSASRVYGRNRVDTSIKTAKMLDTHEIVVASANNFADSLSSSNIVNKYNAALVLVSSPRDVEKIDFKYNSAVIVGGYASVGRDIEDALNRKGVKVTRIAGRDRYETNRRTLETTEYTHVCVADGRNFPDALGAGGLIVNKNIGLMLVDGSRDFTSKAAVVDYTLGGTVKYPKGKRIAGRDRYETNNLLNREFGKNINAVVVDGRKFPDALSAINVVRRNGGNIVLVERRIGKAEKEYLDKFAKVIIIGGPGSVADYDEAVEKPVDNQPSTINQDKIPEPVNPLNHENWVNPENDNSKNPATTTLTSNTVLIKAKEDNLAVIAEKEKQAQKQLEEQKRIEREKQLEKIKAEQERAKAEEARKQELIRQQQLEKERQAREERERLQKQEEEARRKAEEQRRAEEERQRAEENRRRDEEARRQAEEAKRKAEEARRQAEEAKRKAEEERRQQEEQRKREERIVNNEVDNLIRNSLKVSPEGSFNSQVRDICERPGEKTVTFVYNDGDDYSLPSLDSINEGLVDSNGLNESYEGRSQSAYCKDDKAILMENVNYDEYYHKVDKKLKDMGYKPKNAFSVTLKTRIAGYNGDENFASRIDRAKSTIRTFVDNSGAKYKNTDEEKAKTFIYYLLYNTYYKLNGEMDEYNNELSYADVSSIMSLPERGYGLCYAYAQTVKEGLNYMGIKAYATSAYANDSDSPDHEIVVARLNGVWTPLDVTTAAHNINDAKIYYRKDRIDYDWDHRINKYRDRAYNKGEKTYIRRPDLENYILNR